MCRKKVHLFRSEDRGANRSKMFNVFAFVLGVCLLASVDVSIITLQARTLTQGKILFVSDRDGNREIYSVNTDGTNPIRLTNHPAADEMPCLSPDWKKIAFMSDRDGNREIYVMNADGTNPVNLTNHPEWDMSPCWSPDGRKIAFDSPRDGNRGICVMNADGTNPVRLTKHLSPERSPFWSPDGKKIAFVSSRDGNWDIYVMNADGTDPVNLTNPHVQKFLTLPWNRKESQFSFGIGALKGFIFCPSAPAPQCPSAQFTTHYNQKGSNIYVHVY